MKKAVFILTFFLCLFPIFSENESLYDVNYDKPENLLNYDDTLESFQQIYLQYEAAIKSLEDKIREDERQSKNSEVSKVREEEKQNLENAVEKTRENIYQNEIQNVREKETERLTNEITEKLTKELTEKFNSDYEKKLTESVSQKEKEIRDEVSLENASLKEKYKEEVKNELSSDYEKKLAESVSQKENEIRDDVSLENEGLKEKYKEEVKNELSSDYEQKFAESVSQKEKEIRGKVSLENESLKDKYKAQVRQELASEYEAKKNNEIKSLRADLKKQVETENKTATQRVKIITPFCFTVVLIVTSFLFLRWLLPYLKKNSDEKKNEEGILDYWVKNYLELLDKFNGDSSALQDEIDKLPPESNEAKIKRLALNKAREKWNSRKFEKSIGEYQKQFEELKTDFENNIKKWLTLGDEVKEIVLGSFRKNCSSWGEAGFNLAHSKNEKSDIEKTLESFKSVLENYSKRIGDLQADKTLEMRIKEVAKEYQNLSVKFAKGEF